ncbi:uncharacterized protein LOC142574759 [Dermacentor variabilis]|uniref:uncharacterized protein LOC142574759 n=1 Tax=Dermacentor variabilis TaxID=34621 RepID=UPI003F5B6557
MMHFDKYRGVASGLKFTGYTLASLLFPTILTSLKDAYGFRGSMHVYAAIAMNVTALTLLLKEPPWEINARNLVVMDYTMAVFPATIVDYALDNGSSRSHANISVTYCSPAELFGRIVLPLIGDCRFVSRTTLVSASFFLLAAAMLSPPATPSFLAYILVCACATMFTACLLALKPVVVADYFGIESVATSWGFAGWKAPHLQQQCELHIPSTLLYVSRKTPVTFETEEEATMDFTSFKLESTALSAACSDFSLS